MAAAILVAVLALTAALRPQQRLRARGRVIRRRRAEPAQQTESGDSGDQASGEETETGAGAETPVQDGDSAPVKSTPTPIDKENTIITSTGLQYTESEAGTGKQPQPGDVVAVHYTGTLEDGAVFDSSRTRGEPIRFPLGTGSVIPGWDEGIALDV